MNTPKISVIIPTYNRPGFLRQAVHSVLAQTHPVSEIIIVDDCSSPTHHHAISTVEELDERIHIYFFQENKGVSAARNFGFERSKGNYVLFLDDDDLIHRDMVHSCLEKFHQNPDTDVVVCWHGVFYDKSSPVLLSVHEKNSDKIFDSIRYVQKYISFPSIEEKPFSALIHVCPQVASCLIRKESMNSIRFPEKLKRSEDRYFWLTLAAAGCHFLINDVCLAYYRVHSSSSLSLSGTVHDIHKFYKYLLTGGVVRQKQDLMMLHFRYSLRLRSVDKIRSLYQAVISLKYFFHPSVFKHEWHHLLQIFLIRFSRQRYQIAEARRIMLAALNDPS